MKVFLKVFLVISISFNCIPTSDAWEIAANFNDEIKFITSNGSVVQSGSLSGTPSSPIKHYTTLKALTYDPFYNSLFISDSHSSDKMFVSSIFTIELNGSNRFVPVFGQTANNHSDINGVAFDAVENALFWTDSKAQVIMKYSANQSASVLFAFDDEIPQGIAVALCQRLIFWTNSNHSGATIERASVAGTNRQVIINEALYVPVGIAVDEIEKKIYWTDDNEGIYFQIDRANFDGAEREVVYKGRDQTPSGIAITDKYIYWTDWVYSAVWKLPKNDNNSTPSILFKLAGQVPTGITTSYTLDYSAQSDCANISSALKTIREKRPYTYSQNVPFVCFNNGTYNLNGSCECRAGFAGVRCETAKCHNHCVNGDCFLNALDQAQCVCRSGFTGERCDVHVCNNYCLNDARCKLDDEFKPICVCADGYTGTRCDKRNDYDVFCKVFCEQDAHVTQALENNPSLNVCKCNRQVQSTLHETYDERKQTTGDTESRMMKVMHDPVVICLGVVSFLLGVFNLVLLYEVNSLRKKPRINKRIIVSKNVTPLTYRPQQPTTEQCEITIENCCNMNVCETPCYEPPKYRFSKRPKTDEKKVLLDNMEKTALDDEPC